MAIKGKNKQLQPRQAGNGWREAGTSYNKLQAKRELFEENTLHSEQYYDIFYYITVHYGRLHVEP